MLALDLEADALTAPPFDGQCPVCQEAVLVVEVHGLDVVCELAEVLETFACPQCVDAAARGYGPRVCRRCGNTGLVGEMLPAFGVAVDEDGFARYFDGERQWGEAVLTAHVCPVALRSPRYAASVEAGGYTEARVPVAAVVEALANRRRAGQSFERAWAATMEGLPAVVREECWASVGVWRAAFLRRPSRGIAALVRALDLIDAPDA